jgi:hypothetical protein
MAARERCHFFATFLMVVRSSASVADSTARGSIYTAHSYERCANYDSIIHTLHSPLRRL